MADNLAHQQTPPVNCVERFEQRLMERQHDRYQLQLYVSGMTPRSTEAIAIVKQLCERRLPGRYDLQVIDIYQDPAIALSAQVVVAPTLVKCLPLPPRRLIGNLADEPRLMAALDLIPSAGPVEGELADECR